MAEVITETILPGTYIEVRAEGLLTVGAIATGNVGIIGTAEKGDAGIATLSSSAEARARFGEPGRWDPAAPLGLVRAINLLYDNGARTVYAQRVYKPAADEAAENDATKTDIAKRATYRLTDDAGGELLTLRARTPGEWGNRLQIRVEEAEGDELVGDEVVNRNGAYALSAQAVGRTTANGEPPPSFGNITVRQQGLVARYQIKTATADAQTVAVDTGNRRLTFASPGPAAAAEVRASYWVPQASLRKITLRYDNQREVYTVPSAAYLEQRLNDPQNPSKLVEAIAPANPAAGLPPADPSFKAFQNGANGTAGDEEYRAALENLVAQNVQIVVVAGPTFSDVKAAILAHVEKTENLGRERIAVIGADSNDPTKILENVNEVADKRVVLVAPGLKEKDPATGQDITLPPSFAAAAVAGKLASLAPHVSLTNKTLAGIDRLTAEYGYGDLTALVQNRVLALERRRGIRVVKGISTHDEAFSQITLRRIVDYAKTGTRQGANQYIGKLNNRRVRENLRTTLDGFLADLLLREFLTSYKLKVTADRAMEIRGEVLVEMELNPTFSIDVVRVIMTLS